METKWRAKKLERYFYIDDRGRASTCAEINDIVDIDRYNSGNYYQTPQEAEAALRLREAAPKMLEFLVKSRAEQLALHEWTKKESSKMMANYTEGCLDTYDKIIQIFEQIRDNNEIIKQATE